MLNWNKMLFLRKITHVCFNKAERRYGKIWQEKRLRESWRLSQRVC